MTLVRSQPEPIPVEDPSQVGEVRRRVAAVGAAVGLPEETRGRAAIVATELASNVLAHAGSGTVLLRRLPSGLEILALDRGPGMADPGRCLQDGYSTAGTPGTGLGAVRRLSTRFDLYSAPGLGTAVLATILAASPARGGLDVGVVCLPHPGEDRNGDAWAAVQADGRTVLMVVDGLGHGPGAADAAASALESLEKHASREPAEILEAAHLRARAGRGAAAAVVRIAPGEGQLATAGVGNIVGTLWAGGRSRGLAYSHGILGQPPFRARPFEVPWTRETVLVLHSDGLASHGDLSRYPGLLARSAPVIAGVLWRDFVRGRDDVTVVVARERAA